MTTFERIQKVISELTSFTMDEINLNSHLENDLSLDSLDQVELVIALEEEFGGEIPEEDTKKLETVDDIVNYINEKL